MRRGSTATLYDVETPTRCAGAEPTGAYGATAGACLALPVARCSSGALGLPPLARLHTGGGGGVGDGLGHGPTKTFRYVNSAAAFGPPLINFLSSSLGPRGGGGHVSPGPANDPSVTAREPPAPLPCGPRSVPRGAHGNGSAGTARAGRCHLRSHGQSSRLVRSCPRPDRYRCIICPTNPCAAFMGSPQKPMGRVLCLPQSCRIRRAPFTNSAPLVVVGRRGGGSHTPHPHPLDPPTPPLSWGSGKIKFFFWRLRRQVVETEIFLEVLGASNNSHHPGGGCPPLKGALPMCLICLGPDSLASPRPDRTPGRMLPTTPVAVFRYTIGWH